MKVWHSASWIPLLKEMARESPWDSSAAMTYYLDYHRF